MSYIPTVDQAKELVAEFNKEPFHLQHAETVSKVMGELAKEFDPERVDYWAAVGMLHDIDFELYPEQHCVKAQEMLRDKDIDESVIHAVISTATAYASTLSPSFSWKRSCLQPTSLPALSVPSRSCARPAYPIWR